MSTSLEQPANRGRKLAVWLVVVVLLAAAAAGLRPKYQKYVAQVTRMDAKLELRGLAQRLERCFSHTSSYADGVMQSCVVLPQSTADGMYLITAEVAADGFRLIATPQAAQANDVQCGALTLDQAGRQGITGTGTQDECWSDLRD